MDFSGIKGYQEARSIQRANTSGRAKWLQRFDDYVTGRQYAHLNNWWSNAPIWRRAPCIVDPVVATAIRSNVDLVLGEGRYPTVTSRPDEDDDSEGLEAEVSEKLDKFLQKLQHAARLPAHYREALSQAQGVGTAVGIFGVRKGRPFADLVKAQWCTRDLDADGRVAKLVIEYPYLSCEEGGGHRQVVRCRRYRREIDSARDVTFKPVVLRKDGPEEGPVEDKALTVNHALGFCPAVWYRFMVGCSTVNEIDGHPVHEDLTDEIDSLNYALSQKHMAAIYAGQPQPYEIGVSAGYNPTGTRRIVDPMPAGPDGDNGPANAVYAEPSGPREGRLKGPGNVWQYEDPNTKVGYLTIPDGSLKAIDDHCHDVRSKITEGLAVVMLDPDQVKFAATVSGKAMETLRARQLDRCDQIRDDFGDGYLLPSIDMLLRIVRKLKQSGQSVDVPGIDEAIPLLDEFVAAA